MGTERIGLALLFAAGAYFVVRAANASDVATAPNPVPSDDFNGDPYNPTPTYDPDMSTPEAKLRAFLFMIRAAETGLTRARNGSSYNTFYGNSQFIGMLDHPVLTGEKKGVRLSDATCRAAGLNPGCVSTAAGAYQITLPTWDDVRRIGGNLSDFSPASQDEAARRLLALIGALQYVEAGDFNSAVAIASQRWASLPGSTAQQSPQSLERVAAFYNEGFGVA